VGSGRTSPSGSGPTARTTRGVRVPRAAAGTRQMIERLSAASDHATARRSPEAKQGRR
jgi:hypothetical protein